MNNFNYNRELEMLQQLYGSKPENTVNTFNRWKIPVCYEAPFAMDLESLSKSKGLSKVKKVISPFEPTVLPIVTFWKL